MRIKEPILSSISFLTIIPPLIKAEVNEEDLRNSVIFFPVVGFFLGIFSSTLYRILAHFFSREICVLFYLLSLVFLTGGFHIDGLSDTFDGFSIKSTGKRDEDIERRLKVMSSGTQGPLGSLSVLFVFAFKFFLLSDILLFPGWRIFFTLLPVYSRTCVVFCMYYGRSAKNEGLGSLFVGKIKKSHLFLSALSCILLFFAYAKDLYTVLLLLFLLLPLSLLSLFLCHTFQRRFGGLTGDTLGAIIEISEVAFLIGCSLCLKFFI